MSVTVYGIPNCGSVKKALASLTDAGVAFTFHDFRKQGLSETLLKQWLGQTDLAVLINRKGTTWRQLSDAERAQADSTAGAIELLLSKPTLIKRPVVDRAGQISVGQTEF